MFGYSKNFFLGVSVLIGTMVGAGIFGIPYVIAQSGVIPGFFYLLILGGVMILVHLFLGEIALRTKGKHRLIGYSQKYLGNWAKKITTFSTILGVSGALLAYIIIGGNFLEILFSSWISVDSFYLSLFFWAILVYFIFRGIKLIAPTEIFTNLSFFLIIFIISCFALPKINFENFIPINAPNIFLPFGVILFSLVGFTAIPEIGEILKTAKDRKSFKKLVVFTFLLILFFYLIFSLVVLGVSGEKTSPETFRGLVPFLGSKIIFFGALAAVITLADSFLVIALYLKNSLIYDYKFPKTLAALFSCFFPLFLFLIGLRSFIEVISFVGIIIGVIEGIMIVLIFKKAKIAGDREPEYSLKIPSILLSFLILIFIFGAASQFF